MSMDHRKTIRVGLSTGDVVSACYDAERQNQFVTKSQNEAAMYETATEKLQILTVKNPVV
jgi:hypothetical protein